MRYANVMFVAGFLFCTKLVMPQTAGVRAESIAPDLQRQYFPAGAFGRNPEISTYKEKWYSSFLIAMQEPSLLQVGRDNNTATYRFLLILSARAMCFELTVYPVGTGTLITKGVVLYPDKPNRLRIERPVSVSGEQVRDFTTLLQKADFWSSEAEGTNEWNRYRMEGAELILESFINHDYHVVDRWFSRDPNFVRACVFLMSLRHPRADKLAKQNSESTSSLFSQRFDGFRLRPDKFPATRKQPVAGSERQTCEVR
jgi:hypothetical protein